MALEITGFGKGDAKGDGAPVAKASIARRIMSSAPVVWV